jgi:hypothetical protein
MKGYHRFVQVGLESRIASLFEPIIGKITF